MEVDDFMEDGEVEEEDTHEGRLKEEVHQTVGKPEITFSFNDPELFKKRAERFGINVNEENKINLVTKEQIIALYEELEVPTEEVRLLLEGQNAETHYRLQALHLHGTDEMSTKDIFHYFDGYSPATVEWINDTSCNIVWLESWQAARAMLERTSELVRSQSKANDGDAMDQEAIEETQDRSVPPPGVWRKGIPCPKAENLFLRFATVDDCKVKGAQKFSNYYIKHGNPHYGGMKGLISTSRKRRLEGSRHCHSESSVVDSKNPWGSLALEWGTDEQESWQKRFESKKGGRGLSSDLVRRLGHEPPRPSPSRSRDTDDSDGHMTGSDSEESLGESQSSKKRPRMRMYADEEEGKQKKTKNRVRDAEEIGDKLAQLRSSRVKDRLGPISDLRSKIKSRLN